MCFPFNAKCCNTKRCGESPFFRALQGGAGREGRVGSLLFLCPLRHTEGKNMLVCSLGSPPYKG